MPSDTPTTICLTVHDASRLRVLRAQALRTDPWSFSAAPGDDRFESEQGALQSLGDPSQSIFAVEDAGAADASASLVAMAGIARSVRIKHPHLAHIWGVYATPACRGRGLGRAVVEACIGRARRWEGVEVVTLSVSARTVAARRLYESLGFVVWGTEPDCMRIGGASAAEHHMRLRL